MLETVPELLPEIFEAGLFSLGAAILSGAALYLEQIGLETIRSGQPILGLWIAFMGVMALYFGPYLMGYRSLRPRVATLRTKFP